VIWFVDVEKGRENCRAYVEERMIVRVAREVGVAREDVVEGVLISDAAAEGIENRRDTLAKAKGVEMVDDVEVGS
jgi:hypothetical protein